MRSPSAASSCEMASKSLRSDETSTTMIMLNRPERMVCEISSTFTSKSYSIFVTRAMMPR